MKLHVITAEEATKFGIENLCPFESGLPQTFHRDADFCILPIRYDDIDPDKLSRLCYGMKVRPERMVVLDWWSTDPKEKDFGPIREKQPSQCSFIRSVFRQNDHLSTPYLTAWPYPSLDVEAGEEPEYCSSHVCSRFPLVGAQAPLARALAEHGGLKSRVDVANLRQVGTTPIFATDHRIRHVPHVDAADGPFEEENRHLHLAGALQDSRVAAVGAWRRGVLPYGVYQAAAAGRVVFAFADVDKLPLTEIGADYGGWLILEDMDCTTEAPDIIGDWLKRHNDDEQLELGKKARAQWEKFFNPKVWPARLVEVLECVKKARHTKKNKATAEVEA